MKKNLRFLSLMRSQWFVLSIIVVTLFGFSATAHGISNGGFEDGFNRWETIGDTSIQNGDFGSGPTEGISEALITTAGEGDLYIYSENPNLTDSFSGINSVPADQLETFLELPPGSLLSICPSCPVYGELPVEGSAIRQTFSAHAGQVISFDFNFLTDEVCDEPCDDDEALEGSNGFFPDVNDFAFVMINPVQLEVLADVYSSPLIPSSTAFLAEDGFSTFSFTVPTTGVYTLGVGVVDQGDDVVISGLLVDNFSLQCDRSMVGTYAFMDTFPGSAQHLGFTKGNMLALGADITPSTGCTITTATATNLETGKFYDLTHTPVSFLPNNYQVTPMPFFEEDHLGVWTISVEQTCGGVVNVCTRETHNFDKGDRLGVMPYLKDVRASGDPLAPTITWRPPKAKKIPDFCYGEGHPRPPHYRVRLLTASNDQFYRSDRFWDTEHTIPLGVLTVDDIPDTWVRIEHRCQDFDYGLELRSETFRPLQGLLFDDDDDDDRKKKKRKKKRK